MAQHEVHHHLGEHEYSFWPLPVGIATLLLPVTFVSYFVWQKPLLALVLGGVSIALFILSLAGWAYEFFIRATVLYWHFVDLMWLLVASSAYLVGGLV